MPDPSASQSATAGDYSRIIQILGDNAVIGFSPSLGLSPPRRQRPAQTSASADEAVLLVYSEEATAFVGRHKLLDEFITWATTHDPAHPVSVRVLTGNAGAGKTRFAMELCRALGQIQSAAWQAGFVRDREARRFLSLTTLSGWGWKNPTLAIFDYALTLVDVLPAWMAGLGEVPDSPHPLRILLLERNAEEDAGWLKQVFPGGYSSAGRMLDGRPVRLPGLCDPEIQRGIMQAMLDRLGSTVALPADTPAFRDQLAKTDWAGAPLFLMMAAMVMHRQGGVDHALSLRRADLAKIVAQHEYSRLTRASNSNQSMQRFLSHMAALSTICGGLDGGTLLDRIRQEKEFLGHEELGNDAIAHTLRQLLPDDKEGVAPILPDIVGEAFLFDHLGHGEAQASSEAVLRAFSMAPAMVATVLIRCVQDFASAPLAPEDVERATEQQRAVAWLQALGGKKDLPLHLLMLLSNAMPIFTLALRELAATSTERLVADLRELPERSLKQQIEFSRNLNNLAVRLSALGKHEEALAAAQEAVKLHRSLIQIDQDAFRPNLALSLNTLANCRFELAQYKKASTAVQEAVNLYRTLAKINPETFRFDLSKSLNTHANILAEIGQRDEALVSIQEAAAIRRALAQTDPKTFRPYLATTLNNLATILTELRRPEEALNPAQESVTIRRALTKAHPDAFRPDLARSLNNLANIFSMLDKRDKALAATQEAVELYRTLTKAHPDAFRPDLAASLTNLANVLSSLEKHEKALPAAQEAVELYRTLTQAIQEAFLPKLAVSLNTLANILSTLGKRKEALVAAKEAAAIVAEQWFQHPQAFDETFMPIMLNWLSLGHKISIKDAETMFNKNQMLHIRALFEGRNDTL
ncbi:tetratricopeptide repeat protein [Desulfolutivibrio sulfoxidireducens]|uniref:tetratricopeptide repeat protein n=1 Tax=Desulfolutivibrio sulfoxidireducens TaxID=2773299 RepID=UPI00159EA688|nr:tetratricopeptide repeat protein [Desulfolutivibrio sulfoxidireducens]QLA16531.1 tetratricopeptide repeat protein [Desulfolutivibrio sulfoxidireducens]